MRRRLILCACCLWGIVADVWAQPNVSLQQLLQSPELKHAVVGISVKSVKDGRTIVEYEGDKSLQPASVCKILPTALALKTKGSDFRYITKVMTTGKIEDGILQGDVVIRSQGDPCQ